MIPRVCFRTTFAHRRIDQPCYNLSVADILRVLPDFRQPNVPEILVDLNDSSGAETIFVPVVPATPPLLGLNSLSTMV
jgi:hypothetical protein